MTFTRAAMRVRCSESSMRTLSVPLAQTAVGMRIASNIRNRIRRMLHLNSMDCRAGGAGFALAADRATVRARRSDNCTRRSHAAGNGTRHLQDGRLVAQQGFTHDFDGCTALLQKLVMELPKRLVIVLAQFQNFEFAERVVEIRGVGRTPLGFALAERSNLHSFIHEEIDTLLNRHPTGMHLDSDDI